MCTRLAIALEVMLDMKGWHHRASSKAGARRSPARVVETSGNGY
jgi:hypothetical protein